MVIGEVLLATTAERPGGIWTASVSAASLHHRRALRAGPDLPEPEPEPLPKGQDTTSVVKTRDPFNIWGDRAGSRTSGGLGSEPATSSSSTR